MSKHNIIMRIVLKLDKRYVSDNMEVTKGMAAPLTHCEGSYINLINLQ